VPSITVVTPWHNHIELADGWFDAVLPELEDTDECIVVDDGSEPPLHFAHLRANQSIGFCAASNRGLRAANSEAVLLLNNDIELILRGWLNEIRQLIEPGVLVGRLRYDHHADFNGSRFPYLDGWCLAGMRNDLLRLGGFDETLDEPAYYSDNLLCLEARGQGMTLREAPIGLRHIENVTAGPQTDQRVRAATAANKARYHARLRELAAT
jgi:GT2 family glycosyltransferase